MSCLLSAGMKHNFSCVSGLPSLAEITSSNDVLIRTLFRTPSWRQHEGDRTLSTSSSSADRLSAIWRASPRAAPGRPPDSRLTAVGVGPACGMLAWMFAMWAKRSSPEVTPNAPTTLCRSQPLAPRSDQASNAGAFALPTRPVLRPDHRTVCYSCIVASRPQLLVPQDARAIATRFTPRFTPGSPQRETG